VKLHEIHMKSSALYNPYRNEWNVEPNAGVWRREFLAGSVESGAEDPVGILKTKSPEAKNYQRNMN